MANNITVVKPDLCSKNWTHTGRGVGCRADYKECLVFKFDNGKKILAFSREDAEEANSKIEVDELIKEIQEVQQDLL